MTLRRSLLLIVLQALLVFVLGMGVLAPRLLPDPEQPFAPTVQVVALVLALGAVSFLALCWWGSVRSIGRTWAEVGWSFDRLPSALALGLAGGLACLAFEVAALAVAGLPPAEALAQMAAPGPSERGVYLLVGLQAALSEETLFRGNLLGALSARLPIAAAVAASAVIFALYHLNPNPLGLLVKAGFGVVYALLRLRSGGLVAPAVAHVLIWVVAGQL
jgi:membrane protease YdiL (CAAX protease family)